MMTVFIRLLFCPIVIADREVLNWSNGAEECGLSVGVETVMWWC